MIKTENLTMTYKNGFTAVKNLNLTVSEGDIFGFLGPNGAGKTTTIRMLTGLLKPSGGNVFISDLDVNSNENEIKKFIGVVPESHGYYNWMTGVEYLSYFAELFAQDKDKYTQNIEYLLEKVGLSGKKKVLIGHYSRGMKQRLGIAKALINTPKIIFLDEPTLGLDPIGQKDIQNLILEINRVMNVTVFITSHLLKDIEVLCNTICIVQNGELIEQGTIRDLQEKYSENKIIKLKTSDNKKAVEFFKDNELITRIEFVDEYVYIYINKNSNLNIVNDIKRYIVEKLFLNSIDIQEIGKEEITIEDIFFKLTDKKVRGGDIGEPIYN
ncbi:ABC transporter ATP-binding protein [Clostridium bowmanii]|uniref:ABC transporter ATP-binding protein n=1 Tax=Clostridium bowmanii TaxID=132925 RepID=UPI001C0B733F|nr:ABC transporter ATP-binding protein [Clostridium bowmanii]MBU3192236.1 ABC transporter ATP-binding protein [Clostridium bowmanii]MCA1076469.1 ABC transporter ATP-binding protein [Clostridium bowmanii]